MTDIEEGTVPEVVGPVPAGPLYPPGSTSVEGTNDVVIPREQFPNVVPGTNVVLEEGDGVRRYTATVVAVDEREVRLDVDWTSPIEVVDPEADVW